MIGLSLEQLKQILIDTETAYYSGTLRVKTGDKEVWYDTRKEMKARISELKYEIRKLENSSTKKSNVILTYNSKGL